MAHTPSLHEHALHVQQHALQDPVAALSRAERLLAQCDRSTDTVAVVELLQVVALCQVRLGRHRFAPDTALHAVRVATETGRIHLRINALRTLAWTWFHLNAFDRALQCVEEAMGLAAEDLDRQDVHELRYLTACIFRKSGHNKEAIALLQALVPQTTGELKFRCCGALASACIQEGDSLTARSWLLQAEQNVDNPKNQAWWASLSARLAAASRHLEDALDLEARYREVLLKFPMHHASVLLHTALLHLQHADLDAAEQCCQRVSALAALDQEEYLLFLQLQLDLARRAGRTAIVEATEIELRKQNVLQEHLDDIYRLKAAQAQLNHLDTLLRLASSQGEVERLRQAIAKQETELNKLQPGAKLGDSLIDELLTLKGGGQRLADGTPDLQSLGFSLVYQPFVRLTSGQVCGFEALLRLSHPTLGPMLPNEFIPRLERCGDILTVGRWVFAQASLHVTELQAYTDASLVIAVNLSPAQLEDETLASFLWHAMPGKHGGRLPLELEITESLAVHSHPGFQAGLNRLRQLGLDLAIDDFGTGYCNFSHLNDVAPTKVKIDRSLVLKGQESTTGAKLLAAVVATAHGLGLKVTAEGIELAEQAATLQRLGCEFGQGYFFSRPLPLADAKRLLSETAA